MKKLVFPIAVIILIHACVQGTPENAEGDEYPILETMGYYQRFSQKLWFAGINENWELAEFYAHELHEVTEELVESNVMHEGRNLSDMAKSIIEKNIQKVDGTIDNKDQVVFRQSYELMIGSCNVCHIKTEHPFIKILVPNDSTIFNQEF